jgi:hypothetical protein
MLAGVGANAYGEPRWRPSRSPAASAFEEACGDLYIFGLPVLAMARARDRTIGRSANVFRHVRRLSTAQSRAVTTPNNDTLYSSAWLDLRAGPIEIGLPETGAEYFSLALLDMFSNNFHIVGTRTTGGRAHTLRLVPPDVAPKAGEVRAPTWWVWAQARTMVSSPDDLVRARAVQDRIALTAAPGGTPTAALARDADPASLLSNITRLLETEAPPSQADGPLMERLRSAGVRSSAFANPDMDVARACEQGVARARSDIQTLIDASAPVRGWVYSRPTLGDFGTDYLYRASIAVWGLGALPPAEAMYVRAASPQGGVVFDGRRSFRLSFGPGRLPPVGAFWSLSLYEALPTGELFFHDNPIGRYSIGDRTPTLRRRRDGGLDIWISREDPGETHRGNWLPAPDGPFSLVLRAYLPGRALTSGRFRLPPVKVHPLPSR